MSRRSRTLFALPIAGLALLLVSPSSGEPEVLAVAGLKEPVEILRDRWGIAHIYAKNERDLFFAQGFNVARDRLFQLEMWRRQATGTLAEIQGGRAIPQDVGARLLRFRGDMADELGRYHPRGVTIVGAFVEGINAYIDETGRDPSLLPVEFRALGIKPGRWTPEVVVSRHNGLFRNATQEVQVARLVHLLGEDRARELLDLHPGKPRIAPDPKLDLAAIGEKNLVIYKASRAAVRFRTRGRRAGLPRPGGRVRGGGWRARRPSNGRVAGEQQLGRGGFEDGLGQADHGQRPAPDDRQPVAPLLGPPRRPGVGRGRRRRARLARGLDRPQPARGLGVHHLPHRPGRPLRLRHRPGQSRSLPVQGRLGADAGRARVGRGEGARDGRGRAQVHQARPGDLRGSPEPQGVRPPGGVARARLRALPGQPPDRPGGDLGRVRRGVPTTSGPPPRTWSGPTSTATSAGRPWGCRRSARGGTGSCRSPATAGSSGKGSSRPPTSRPSSTPLEAGLPRPIRTTSRPAIRTPSATSGPKRSGSSGSANS